MEAEAESCPWSKVFNASDQLEYYNGLGVASLVSAVLGSAVTAAILMLADANYRTFSFYAVVALSRRCGWLKSCNSIDLQAAFNIKPDIIMAFIGTFFPVFEIEALTHVCIERYVVAKYIYNGWQIPKYYGVLFNLLSLGFAAMYTVPTLYLGGYGYEFDCDSLTYNMILPSSNWKKFYMIAVFFLISVKPVMFMIMMLYLCRKKEKLLKKTVENQIQIQLTKNIIAVTTMTVLCYVPLFLVKSLVVLSQLYNDNIILPTAENIKWAFWLHWVSPAVSSLTFFIVDEHLRLGFVKIFFN